MDNAFTFKEISDLVKSIPIDKWEHEFSGDAEHLEFRMVDTDLSLSLYGDNKGRRSGKAPVELSSVSVTLGYVNKDPIVEYKGTKPVQELFYSTRKRVETHSEAISEQSVEEQLRGFNVNPSIVRKIVTIQAKNL
jgi:hypothetical protein